MNMNIQKWAPWNWLKNEDNHGPHHSAVADRIQSHNYNYHDLEANMNDNPVYNLHREINRIFGDAFSAFSSFPSLSHTPLFATPVLKPNIDIAETKNTYSISIEVPGVDEKDITLELDADGLLTISGEKKTEDISDDKNYHRVERSYGAFKRVLTLPEDALGESIDASFKNGVLQVTLMKEALQKPKETKVIDIRSAA